jgi:L-lactate utilization protein LutB
MKDRIDKVMHNLEKNNIKSFFVNSKDEVVPLVSELLNDGDTISVGGSISLFESGVLEHLRCDRYKFLDRYTDGLSQQDIREIYLQSMDADAYFCSSNAVTESGELYNVDGNSNRICAIAYGPKSVIMVVGKNKIVKGIDEAVNRVKTITAPKIGKRLGNRTFCKEKGYCVSIEKGQADMTAGCSSPERTCCNFLVSGKQRIKNRIKVIIVNEDLGY